MSQTGLALTVQNGHEFVKQQADWISATTGGSGAVREATDFILRSQGLLDDMQAGYLR